MSRKQLTATDICNIIKSCQDLHVRKLVYGALTIEFHPTADEIAAQFPTHNLSVGADFLKQSDVHPLQTSNYSEDDLLIVEDPVEFERRQLEGDDGNEGRDHDL